MCFQIVTFQQFHATMTTFACPCVWQMILFVTPLSLNFLITIIIINFFLYALQSLTVFIFGYAC